jgi:hypothetical protein
MTIKEIFIASTIHIIIPLIGVIYFVSIKRKMKTEMHVNALKFELFILFVSYGGLLLVTLTTLFWQWSGLASFGTFYLTLFAPILIGKIAYKLNKIKTKSKYHLYIYYASMSYFIIAPTTLLLLFLFSDMC